MHNKLRTPKAQAMVEFALVLPLLMFLIVGLLEVGRAIFMYSSVVTASREGSRYGSAAGDNLNGDPLYQDCVGIRNAVKKVGILLNLQDDDIIIQYDRDPEYALYYPEPDPSGYDPVVFDICDGEHDAGVDNKIGDRIRVTVTAQYSPMIPLFLPLTTSEFESVSVRTVNTIISIHEP
jgi:hypothetical protein